MSFITKEDLANVIYEGNIDKISGGDDSKVQDAIDGAIAQASSYLAAYDLKTIFALEGADRNGYADLMLYVKDIAKWHFIAVCNASVDLALAEKRYNDAIAALKYVGKNLNPAWPLATSEQAELDGAYGSNAKFNNNRNGYNNYGYGYNEGYFWPY